MEGTFEEAFKVPFFVMKITDASERDKKWFLMTIFYYAIYTCIFCLLGNNLMIAIEENNFSDACYHGIYCVIYIVITTILIIVNVHYKTAIMVLKRIKQDFETDLTMEEKEIFKKYIDRSRILYLYWSLISFGGLLIIVADHLTLQLYNLFIGRFVLLEIYPLTYPLINENNTPKILLFILSYFVIIYFVGYSTIIYLTFAYFGHVCILHSMGLLEIAELKLKNLFLEINIEIVQLKMMDIIKILQHAYDIVEDINTVYSVFYEFVLKGAVIVMPIGWWIHSKATDHVNYDILGIILRSLVVTAGNCYCCSKLQEKGNDIALAIYSSGWEKRYDRSTRRTLLIMLARAQKPVAIRSLFHVISLETLGAILRQSYAILNVMSATGRPK